MEEEEGRVMPKWEYQFELFGLDGQIGLPPEQAVSEATEKLNKLGQDGWEAVGLGDNLSGQRVVLLKRMIPE